MTKLTQFARQEQELRRLRMVEQNYETYKAATIERYEKIQSKLDTANALIDELHSALASRMTADDTTPQTSADDMIEAAAQAMLNHGERDTLQWGSLDADPSIYLALARALADAHLLADPTDRDERRNEAYRAQLARADRAEAEVADLRQKLSDCELLLTDLGKTHTRVSGERDELRAMRDRVRALINDPEAASLRHHVNGDFTWVIKITALNAALDGGES